MKADRSDSKVVGREAFEALWHAALDEVYGRRETANMLRWAIDSYREQRSGGTGDTAFPDLRAWAKDLDIMARLQRREPLDYILGSTEFYGLRLHVNRDVLIPRPETEELVEWVLEKEGERAQPRVLDIGTGSGCIPIALQSQRNGWSLEGIDCSLPALEVARRNAERHRMDIVWTPMDILRQDLSSAYDIIISNPPYIPLSERGVMSASTLAFEPEMALFTQGKDGLEFYRRIAGLAVTHLRAGGSLFFELNEFRASAVAGHLENEGWKTEIRRDLQGKDRMLRAVRD